MMLSGNKHVYAWQVEGPTLYVVTGTMGDYLVGGCDRFGGSYQGCLPLRWVEGFAAKDRYDHFLDIVVHANRVVTPVFLDPTPEAPPPPVEHARRRPER